MYFMLDLVGGLDSEKKMYLTLAMIMDLIDGLDSEVRCS